MDIFAGMQPRSGPLPIEGDSQQPIRNFLSGFQMRQQQQEMALKTKEVASNLVHQDLQNRLAQRNLDFQTQASTEMAGWNDLSDEDVLKLRPNGNPFRDRPLEQFQNNATAKIQAKTSNLFKQQVTIEGTQLLEANPMAFPDFMNSFDQNGNPTAKSMQILQDNAQSIKRIKDEKAFREGKVPGGKPTASVAITDEILKSESEANKAEAEGNMVEATRLRDRATLLREQTKGQEVVTGYDDQGRPIIRMGKGVGAPTVATQSQAQQKLLRYENSVELINKLQKTLKSEHLGAAGVAGEWIMDRGMSQLIPELANKDRIDARSALIAAREGLLGEISNDPRFSNMDREEVSRALPSSGIFESLPDATQRLNTVRSIITQRGKIYAKGVGQSPLLWTMTADEIKAEYKKFQTSNGKEGIDRETALGALTRFY